MTPIGRPRRRANPEDAPSPLAAAPQPGSGVGAPSAAETEPHLRRTPLLDAALDRAVTVPSTRVHAHVESLRRRNPDASPAQIIRLLEREYLLVIAGTGGAVGAAAAAPAIGTSIAVALTASDVATFFASSAAFSLAIASVHGIEVNDVGRRRALVLATIVGESGFKVAQDTTELTSGAFARLLLTKMPTTTIKRVNGTLTRRLVRRQAARQGALAFGRLAPFGIGAVIGVTGARALGKTVVAGAQRAFGPPPARFPQLVQVIETGGQPRLVPMTELPAGPSHDGYPPAT